MEMEHCLPARWRRGARAALPGRPACGCVLDGGRSREERVAGGGHSREERAQIRSGARGAAGGMGGGSGATGMGGEERRVGMGGEL